MENTHITKHFIQEFIEEDLNGKTSELVTRFPPEPNGHLHIGHAKSIILNFGLAKQYGGVCNLRFDDTNPSKESWDYVNSIIEDVKWLGYSFENRMFFSSNYFSKFYEYSIVLIKKGLAYVCDLTQEQLQEYRGTYITPGTESPWRNRSIEENLRLFFEMKEGKYKDGEKTLRAKIDMKSPNIVLRDPVIYRIAHVTHYNTGDEWCIYPMYDYAHPLEDAIEGVTHSLCSMEFENNRPLYNWFIKNIDFEKKPRQIEFAKMQISHTVMGKRYLRQLVENGQVEGWDDPRLPTLKGLRRRGYTPEIIKDFCEKSGISKATSTSEMYALEHSARDILKGQSPSVMAVINPLKVIITNYDQERIEYLDIENSSEADMGIRQVPFNKELYIEKDDFMEFPDKKFHRLTLGNEVRLKGAYFIKCNEVIKDKDGNIKELHCSYDIETKSGTGFTGRKVKGTIHWVSASTAISAQVRFFDYIINENNVFNEDSIKVYNAFIEPYIKDSNAERFQFLRHGYFIEDSVLSMDIAPVYNCIVQLKSSY